MYASILVFDALQVLLNIVVCSATLTWGWFLTFLQQFEYFKPLFGMVVRSCKQTWTE